MVAFRSADCPMSDALGSSWLTRYQAVQFARAPRRCYSVFEISNAVRAPFTAWRGFGDAADRIAALVEKDRGRPVSGTPSAIVDQEHAAS